MLLEYCAYASLNVKTVDISGRIIINGGIGKMEKHIKIICEQNSYTDIECPACHQQIKIKTEDFLKHKNIYQGTCKKCDNKFTYDTSKLFKEFEAFKKFC